jgi:hypothetical protein
MNRTNLNARRQISCGANLLRIWLRHLHGIVVCNRSEAKILGHSRDLGGGNVGPIENIELENRVKVRVTRAEL